MKAPRLRQCPFCGAKGVYTRAGEPWAVEPMWTAGCEYGHASSPDMDTKEEAADWWNRRASDRKR